MLVHFHPLVLFNIPFTPCHANQNQQFNVAVWWEVLQQGPHSMSLTYIFALGQLRELTLYALFPFFSVLIPHCETREYHPIQPANGRLDKCPVNPRRKTR